MAQSSKGVQGSARADSQGLAGGAALQPASYFVNTACKGPVVGQHANESSNMAVDLLVGAWHENTSKSGAGGELGCPVGRRRRVLAGKRNVPGIAAAGAWKMRKEKTISGREGQDRSSGGARGEHGGQLTEGTGEHGRQGFGATQVFATTDAHGLQATERGTQAGTRPAMDG